MVRYHPLLIGIHWLVALGVLVAYITSGDPTEAGNAFEELVGQTHVAAGDLVVVLVLLRLPLRLILGAPAAVPMPQWQALAAKGAHVALYGLMLLVPLAGWCALSERAADFSVFGLALPLLSDVPPLLSTLGDLHPLLGNAFLWLAGIHAAAALWHHFKEKDDTLKKMAPWVK
ncbi:cytochrome b [Pseudaeromonas sharmana]|uniref:Cytochrome b n=1 Tax=Pseudaeromonas sharmana TaxID=328412 RepID=A0ABV8CPF8_9GAMM